MYQTRQRETFGPIPDNDWEECSEEDVRFHLGSSGSVHKFSLYESLMKKQGKTLTAYGLIDFRWIEEAS